MEEQDKKQLLEKIKKFFKEDLKIKETLINIAPTELDDYDENTRMKYIDKIYKTLEEFEMNFIDIAKDLVENPEIIEKIKIGFNKSKNKLLISNYEAGMIQKIYKEQFTSMDIKLIEDVKKEFVGYYFLGWNLDKIIDETKTVNEMLHVFHSYVENNHEILESLPCIDTKKNMSEWSIALYGEENEMAKKIFEEFPIDIDCGNTNIVSLENQILMMVRDKGHALTINIDTSEENNMLVKYFIPKICNRKMVEQLKGISLKSITENGAIGRFETSKEKISQDLFGFIKDVPGDEALER